MEDMKGKIRVYCRTRPLSHSELERGNYVCVKFPDEVTINVETNKGVKEFIFDQCFTPLCETRYWPVKLRYVTGSLLR